MANMWIHTLTLHSFTLNGNERNLGMLQQVTLREGGLFCCSPCELVLCASCTLQCWPSIRRLWTPGPRPLRLLSGQFAWHKLAFTLCLSVRPSLYSSQGVPPAPDSNGRHVKRTALGCQQIYLATDLRSPVGMSIICQCSTRVFGVVTLCTQTR